VEIRANTRDLAAALKVVSNTYTTSGTDIASHYVFRVLTTEDGQKIEILSHKQPGRVFSSCPCVSEVEAKDGEEQAFTIEAGRFDSLVNTIKDAVVSLKYEAGVVVVEAPPPWGKVEFKSLDPDKFMFWDSLFQKATLIGEVAADHLTEVFGYAKLFISDQETRNPGMCVTEARDGLLLSTNMVTVTSVRTPLVEGSKMRIHNKDVAPLLKFLAASERAVIKVYEDDRNVFFHRADGALFGAARFNSAFPKLGLPPENSDDAHWWVLPKERVLSALSFLQTGVNKDDKNLYLRRMGSEVQVAMDCETGGRGQMLIPLIDSGSSDNAKALPGEGFSVDRTMVKNVLSQTEADEVRFGLNTTPKGGFLRLVEERDSGNYRMISTWLQG
jgi:hypothetical protein